MKMPTHVLGLVLLSVLFLLPTISFTQTSLHGKVTEKDSGEPVLFGSVALFKAGILVTGVETDFDGNYSISNIDPGTYDVEASYVGLTTQKITNVIVKEGKANLLDIQLGLGFLLLCDVVVEKRRTPSLKRKKKRSKPKAAVKDATTSLSYHSSRAESTDYYVDGIRVRSESAAKKAPSVSPCIVMSSEAGIAESPTVAVTDDFDEEAGQITAGEWKDLDNWTFWTDLQQDEPYLKYQAHWKFHPNQRYAVALTGRQDQAVMDATVSLLDPSGKTIWQGKTDNQGRAELWSGVYGVEQKAHKIKIEFQDYTTIFEQPRNFTNSGIHHYKIPVACSTTNAVDISFVVDATGSMGDEIQFLKAELKDVIERAKEENEGLHFRLGSVFYKDKGDEYVTQASPLSADISQTVNFIRAQHAGGGGDYPEAVHSALEEALRQDWNPNARSRMLFLLLDAPPHHTPEVQASLQQSIQKAAKLGIKIIPVTASGIQKDTEFLMKYFSMLTNSTYTFITDHSGIGNAHLAPTAEEYNVETLNELMLRLILENTEYSACEESNDNSLVQKPESPMLTPPNLDLIQNQDLLQGVQVFPNPAKTHFFLELASNFDAIYLFNSQGQLIRSFTENKAGKTQKDIQDLPSGMYVLHFVKGNEIANEQLMVVQE